MGNIWTIYRREISTYFSSPVAYLFIVLFLLVLAVMFFVVNQFFSQAIPDMRGYFSFVPWIFSIFIPAVTMRLWSEEKRAGTIELLMTMPLKGWQLVLAKFFAAFTVIALALGFTLVVPWSLTSVVDHDWGTLMATYVGALAMASVYIALGAWISTWSKDQVVTLLFAVFLSFILTLIGFQPVVNWIEGLVEGLGAFIGWFGTFYHFREFQKGLLSLVGFIYAGSLTAFFLILNNIFVEGRKF